MRGMRALRNFKPDPRSPLAGVKYATVDPDMVVKPTDVKAESRE